jgi:hypothetical protein
MGDNGCASIGMALWVEMRESVPGEPPCCELRLPG